MNEHIEELADLYAVGALDDAERREVDRHVDGCDECARALGEAEARVTMLAECEPQHRPPPQLARRISGIVARPSPSRAGMFVAVAAALVVGVVPSAYLWQQNRSMHAAMVADAAAMDRLATTPHRQVRFTEMSDGSAASVMYGADGSWYVVLVTGASHALSVAWMHDGQRTMLGTAEPHGDVAMLYLPKSHRMDQIALMDGERVVAQAQLAY